MTTENKAIDDLLKPRIKVENPYPNSPFTIGEIICEPSWQQTEWAKECPNIFRFLKWWEERLESEMPEYVKEEGGNIYKVVYYERSEMRWMECRNKNSISTWAVNSKVMCFFEPSTEAEYLNYQKQQHDSHR